MWDRIYLLFNQENPESISSSKTTTITLSKSSFGQSMVVTLLQFSQRSKVAQPSVSTYSVVKTWNLSKSFSIKIAEMSNFHLVKNIFWVTTVLLKKLPTTSLSSKLVLAESSVLLSLSVRTILNFSNGLLTVSISPKSTLTAMVLHLLCTRLQAWNFLLSFVLQTLRLTSGLQILKKSYLAATVLRRLTRILKLTESKYGT